MTSERLILACDTARGELRSAVLRLLRLGFDTLYTRLDEAPLAAGEASARVRAIVFPPELDPALLNPVVERIAMAPGSPGPPALVVVGARPEEARCALLREAGVRGAVWSPDDDGALRFVLNTALALPAELTARRELRAPTQMLGSLQADGPNRHAIVYTLSARGAFFEMPRPLGKGTSVRISLWLPERTLRARGVVIHAQEPDVPREVRWPLGMAILFAGLGRADDTFLRRYVAERAALITL